MKLTKLERAALLITLVLVVFVAGFFVGRKTMPGEFSLSQMEPAAPSTSPSMDADTDTDTNTDMDTPEPSRQADEILDLNAATREQLEALPGIGQVMAQRILDYREESGGFHSVEELKNVSGIGDKTYEALKDLVKVG